MKYFNFILILGFLVSCSNEDVMPRPKGYLSLNYPKKTYSNFNLERPYVFEVADKSKVVDQPKQWLKIEYPQLKATINLTYRPVKGNLRELLMEAEKLVYEHAIKAENISSVNFENTKTNVFGTMHEITGNAASNVQFHVTDNANHFLKGSLFFYSKPNFDSILPAVSYIKKDMVRIMESLEWKK